MITWQTFLTCTARNAARIRSYALGGDGSDGKSDCIGLIIGALALAGQAWPGIHGTNYAARNRMDGLCALESEGQLFRGQVLFKARSPGDSGYNLPDAYRDSPDRRDYYHAGVVTSVQPLIITHCTDVASGIQVDTALGRWAWGGRLNLVDYADAESGDSPAVAYAVVTADNAYPVRLRAAPSTQAAVLASVPQGAVAAVLDNVSADWARIRVEGKTGYMMRRFLRPLEEGERAVARTALAGWQALAAQLADGIADALRA